MFPQVQSLKTFMSQFIVVLREANQSLETLYPYLLKSILQCHEITFLFLIFTS
jgi:hypothetical protein